MFRIVFLGFVVSTLLGWGEAFEGNSNNSKTIAYSPQKIDTIIVGRSVNPAHFAAWQEQNKKYIECGLCGEVPQAFPGD